MCKQTINRLQALFNHTKCDTVKNLPLSSWALRILHICPIQWVLFCPCGYSIVTVLYCTCLPHYWGGCEMDDFTAAVHVCWGSAGTWLLRTCRPWWRIVAEMHNAVFKATPVKYWRERWQRYILTMTMVERLFFYSSLFVHSHPLCSIHVLACSCDS